MFSVWKSESSCLIQIVEKNHAVDLAFSTSASMRGEVDDSKYSDAILFAITADSDFATRH